MTVTVDATATVAASLTTGVSTLTNSSLTVGAGATALLAMIMFNEFSANVSSTVTMNWDNAGIPQGMTSLGTMITTGNLAIQLFGLVNPTPGNKILTATWTETVQAVLSAQSYRGSINSGVATAFLHFATSSGTAGAPTITITSATGNISVCVAAEINATTALTATGSAAIYANQTFAGGVGGFGTIASYAPGAATVAWTAAPTSTEWAIAGVEIAAAPRRGYQRHRW